MIKKYKFLRINKVNSPKSLKNKVFFCIFRFGELRCLHYLFLKQQSMTHYRLSLTSQTARVTRLRSCIAVLSRIEHYSDTFASGLELSVHEAFVNAVRHGNREDASLAVVVTFIAGNASGERFLEVRVSDCGEGFDSAQAIARASSPEGLLACSGRGLFLIDYFTESHRIEKHAGGCELVLRYIPY
jgi:anti-sigma regulatory factor (Ser/Thr protein kinase)